MLNSGKQEFHSLQSKTGSHKGMKNTRKKNQPVVSEHHKNEVNRGVRKKAKA